MTQFARCSRPASPPKQVSAGSSEESAASLLEPARLPDHIDALYRAAYALSGSRHDAEDLVQETFAQVLKRPRFVTRELELGYLLRALRNTHYSRHRTASRRPVTVTLADDIALSTPSPAFDAQEIMQAVASAPAVYRDAVVAVDILGMSYREAARALRTREATLTTRLHRGRQHIARVLIEREAEPADKPARSPRARLRPR